jgi:hypothetical protein
MKNRGPGILFTSMNLNTVYYNQILQIKFYHEIETMIKHYADSAW